MTARLAGVLALFVLPLMAMPARPQSAPTDEPDGYRMQDMVRYVVGSKMFLEK